MFTFAISRCYGRTVGSTKSLGKRPCRKSKKSGGSLLCSRPSCVSQPISYSRASVSQSRPASICEYSSARRTRCRPVFWAHKKPQPGADFKLSIYHLKHRKHHRWSPSYEASFFVIPSSVCHVHNPQAVSHEGTRHSRGSGLFYIR
jgi:hypothetical protein